LESSAGAGGAGSIKRSSESRKGLRRCRWGRVRVVVRCRFRIRSSAATFSGEFASNLPMSQFQVVEVSSEVILAAARGEARAHEQIYLAYRRVVYNLIRRLIVRPAVADEILQDVFVEILRSIGSYTASGPFGGWVRTVAINKCLMHLRSPWHRSLLWIDAEEHEETAKAMNDLAMHGEAVASAGQDLERALATLPALTRSVVWLHDVEGYTHGEIAHLLGRTTSFSKSQLSRAHARLRDLLDSPDGSLSCIPVSTSC
jgi:RNA polymerase sigma factor (sigma-70 family)